MRPRKIPIRSRLIPTAAMRSRLIPIATLRSRLNPVAPLRSRPNHIAPLRSRLIPVAIYLAVPLLALWAMTLGDLAVSLPDVVAAVGGRGRAGDILVVQHLRLPRVLAALIVGAGLAVSGALFQALMRNPLAAPDVLGITEGAACCLVLATVFGVSALLLPVAACFGAAAAATLLLVLARRAALGADTMVLIGIGLQTFLAAVTLFLITRFPVEVAQRAALWTLGSLYGRGWAQVWSGMVALTVLLPAALLLVRQLRVLELGTDIATALGMRVGPARAVVTGVAVALAAVAVSVGGPIAFVALAVPHLARWIAGPLSRPTLMLTAALGALVVLGADLLAQHALTFPLPVGSVTATVGAPLFLGLLLRRR